MIAIIYETHATSLDNEPGLASGHYDVDLSARGKQQARELGERYCEDPPDVVFCSDLRRAHRTAEIAFTGRGIRIIKDARLKELDYGDWTRRPGKEVHAERAKRITEPFPNGESYMDAMARMRSFLADLQQNFDGKRVLIVHTTLFEEDWQWQPSLSEALDGLTATQAAWKPGPERHSVWQIVRHLILWKRAVLKAYHSGQIRYLRALQGMAA